MDSLLGTFHINFQGVLFQLINFAVVFTVLYFFAIKPLTKMLDERTETIDKGLKDADRHAKLVKEAEEVYKTELEKARKEAFDIVQSAKKDAEQKRDALLSETKAQVDAMLKEGKATLEREKESIIKDAQNKLTLAQNTHDAVVTTVTQLAISRYEGEPVSGWIFKQAEGLLVAVPADAPQA